MARLKIAFGILARSRPTVARDPGYIVNQTYHQKKVSGFLHSYPVNALVVIVICWSL